MWYDPVSGRPLKRTLHYMLGSEETTFTDTYEEVNFAANFPKEKVSIEKKN
jgi:hypothetical protein